MPNSSQVHVMLSRSLRRTLVSIASLIPFAIAAPLAAQEKPDPAGLGLELNRAVDSGEGCRLGFITRNDLGIDLSRAAFEVVLFNADDLIDRLLVLDFGAMPDGRTKVREFKLPETPCDGVKRILVNDAAACEGEGIDPASCIARLDVTSKADIAFGL